MKLWVIFLSNICCALLALLLTAGCEGGGGGDSDDAEPVQTAADTAAPQTNWDQSKIDGHWEGHAGTVQSPTDLTISSKDGIGSGSIAWPGGDIRLVNGRIFSDNSAILYIEGGDYWSVSWRGNSMSGTGTKPDGNTYPVSFSR